MIIFDKYKTIIKFIFPFLCIVSPLYVHLRVQDVLEVSVVVTSVFVFICFLIGLFLVINKNINDILISLLIAINFDLYLNFSKSVSYIILLSKYQALFVDIFYFLSIFFVSLFLIKKSKLFFNFMFIFLFFSTIGTIFLPYQSPFHSFEEKFSEEKVKKKKNRILVITFDGLMGIEGIKRINSKKSEEFQNHVSRLNKLHNFSVFNKAYSRFSHTFYSMGHMLNYDFESLNNNKVYFDERKSTLIKNKFFTDRPDYLITVYQTDQVNFCKNRNIVKCKTFNPYKSNFLDEEGLLNKDVRLSIQNFNSAIQSTSMSKYVFTSFVKILNKFNGKDLRIDSAYYAKQFSKWFDTFVDDISNSETNSIYFAHFMIPHEPYLLNEECILHNPSNDLIEKIKIKDDFKFLETFSKEQQKKRLTEYEKYFQQSKCVLNKIDDLIEKLKENNKFDSTDIYIFSDHGTRISEGIFYETTSNEDLIDNHSTFFLVKKDKQIATIFNQKVSTQKIFSFFFNDSFENQPIDKLSDDGEVSVKSKIDGKYKSKKINF